MLSRATLAHRCRRTAPCSPPRLPPPARVLLPPQGFSAIWLAAQENHCDIAEVLIGVGGSELANMRTKDGRTAMFAAAQYDCADMIHLHRCGGDIELPSRGGVLPMWVGSQMGSTSAVLALIELGAACDCVRPNPADPDERERIARVILARDRVAQRARIAAKVADAKRARK